MGKSKDNHNFVLLRRLLKAFGLSEARIQELIERIQEWLFDDQIQKTAERHYPYHLRDDFLSPAELNFYRVLQTAVSDWAIVFVKVSLGDLFFAQTGDYSKNRVYRNKIDRKHVDFLLCDPKTIRPILGIELDDKSHQKPERKKRDNFVNNLFEAAQLPLARVPVKHTYPIEKLNTFLHQLVQPPKESNAPNKESRSAGQTTIAQPTCPKCSGEMKLRKAKQGRNAGQKFWGCIAYPQCRGIRSYD